MDLAEAINHCLEKSKDSDECGTTHKQYAMWLKELKELKELKDTKGIHICNIPIAHAKVDIKYKLSYVCDHCGEAHRVNDDRCHGAERVTCDHCRGEIVVSW